MYVCVCVCACVYAGDGGELACISGFHVPPSSGDVCCDVYCDMRVCVRVRARVMYAIVGLVWLMRMCVGMACCVFCAGKFLSIQKDTPDFYAFLSENGISQPRVLTLQLLGWCESHDVYVPSEVGVPPFPPFFFVPCNFTRTLCGSFVCERSTSLSLFCLHLRVGYCAFCLWYSLLFLSLSAVTIACAFFPLRVCTYVCVKNACKFLTHVRGNGRCAFVVHITNLVH